MIYRRQTGGNKEFRYTKEDIERIQSEDTEETKEFKRAYKEWLNSLHLPPTSKNYNEYQEEYLANKGHKHPKHGGKDHYPIPKPDNYNTNKPKKRSYKLLIFLILLGLLVYYFVSDVKISETAVNISTQNISKNVTEKVNFEEYVINDYKYHNTEVTLQGYLGYPLVQKGTGGVYEEVLVDDADNTIRLKKITEEQKKLFTRQKFTNELYEVTGRLEQEYRIPILHVSNIKQVNKPVKEVTDTVNIENRYEKITLMPRYQYWSQELKSIFVTVKCEDGTITGFCSSKKPYYCSEGKLIENSQQCNCPTNYRPKENSCELIPRCSDKTIYGECSDDKPFFCSNGNLIENVNKCGCSYEFIAEGNNCVSKYETGPSTVKLKYIVDGKTDYIEMTTYQGLSNYLASKSRYYYCDPTCPSTTQIELRYLDDTYQKTYLEKLSEEIRAAADSKDDQLRVAVSLVQNIPYDYTALSLNSVNNRYPYEVIYDNKGVCGEKSRLLAFILRDLGFKVALLRFEAENHQALGVACPSQYDYEDTGYCFIEATRPIIITSVPTTYVGVGELTSQPEILKISDGLSFNSVQKEYQDAQLWDSLTSRGPVLSQYEYGEWRDLVEKYGIEID